MPYRLLNISITACVDHVNDGVGDVTTILISIGHKIATFKCCRFRHRKQIIEEQAKITGIV